MLIINTHALLQSVNLQSWWKRLSEFLGLVSVVHNQSVLVSGASNLELGLSELLTGSVDFRVGLNGSGLDVAPSSKLNELLNVGNFSSHCVYLVCTGEVEKYLYPEKKAPGVGVAMCSGINPRSPNHVHVTPAHYVQKEDPNQ